MIAVLQMVGLLALVLATSMAVSYWITAKSRKKVVLVPIPENTRVRMVGPGGAYRCYFLRRTKAGLVFSSPLQRDHYIPVRVGETMMVQAPLSDCVLTFRASILGRDADTHEFTLSLPERIRHIDRRSESRDHSVQGSIVSLNNERATLCDLSAGGARVVCGGKIVPGDAVRLDLPSDLGTTYGWALECVPSVMGNASAKEIRIRFEAPLSGLAGARRRSLYSGI